MKNSLHIKLKAGALQYVIFISVVIALLVFAFILLTYTQQKFKLKAENFKETVHRSNLALDYSLKNTIAYNESFKVTLTDNVNEETTILKKHWGVYDVHQTTSTIKKETFSKIGLLGGFTNDKISLYLQDNNQPLVVVGNTRIEGKTKLPKQGLKRGSIAGHSYLGNQLVYGSVGLSKSNLPEIENKEAIKQLCQGNFMFQNTKEFDLTENLTLANSFTESTKVFKSFGSLDLREMTLTGNIVIQSNTAIRVYESAHLIDVILIAPTIEMRNNVKGNFQAFASKEIKVGSSCKLNYPSALVVYEKRSNKVSNIQNTNQEFNSITIDRSSEIKGVVCFFSENNENNFKSQILLEENSEITGEVYCNGNFELKGTINGSVFTRGFIANQFGSVYQNHIYNGKILTRDFPEEYSGLFLENDNKSVVKWLY